MANADLVDLWAFYGAIASIMKSLACDAQEREVFLIRLFCLVSPPQAT